MTDEPEYPVGKGRPPEHTRWKSGQSGNPKGRPKRAKSAIPHEKVLGRMVTITMDGVPKEMRADQAFIARLFQQAVSGGVRVAKVASGAITQFEASQERSNLPMIVFSVYPANGCVNRALRDLRIAILHDRFRPTCKLLLEPWVVEMSLQLRRGKEMSPDEQKRVLSATRAPHKVKWPAWWKVFSSD